MKRRDDDDALVVGLAALALFALRRGSGTAVVRGTAEAEPDGLRDGRWMWPIPTLIVKRRPLPSGVVPGPVRYEGEVSQEFRRGNTPPPAKLRLGPLVTDSTVTEHLGVDLMYRRKSADDLVRQMSATALDARGERAGDGTGRWFAPPEVPVYAARDGVVWSVEAAPRGWTVVLDHRVGDISAPPFATFYTHLSSTNLPLSSGGFVAATKKQYRVKAGDIIGRMGADPLDPQRLRHLHFAVWWDGAGDIASIDPGGAMAGWSRQEWLVPNLTAGEP